ncbi:hypothetical protein EYV94_08040 [Puteibacter caeruleilacunae]|nr:hypothetical protein EYV94_08040 [Puteibacter caeruleilacunae]
MNASSSSTATASHNLHRTTFPVGGNTRGKIIESGEAFPLFQPIIVIYRCVRYFWMTAGAVNDNQ